MPSGLPHLCFPPRDCYRDPDSSCSTTEVQGGARQRLEEWSCPGRNVRLGLCRKTFHWEWRPDCLLWFIFCSSQDISKQQMIQTCSKTPWEYRGVSKRPLFSVQLLLPRRLSSRGASECQSNAPKCYMCGTGIPRGVQNTMLCRRLSSSCVMWPLPLCLQSHLWLG